MTRLHSSTALAGPSRRGRLLRAAAILTVFLASGLGTILHAANLQVSPISLEFSPKDQAQGIWLSNSGTSPLRAQVRVQQWSQADGKDQLAPARELVASPPAVDIPPGEKQLVRIIRLQPVAPAQEQTFRLIIDELPAAAAPADAGKPSGLQFLFRYSVPVFVSLTEPVPQTGKPSDISALKSSVQAGTPAPVLAVRNNGAQRLKISQLSYVSADGLRTPLLPGLVGYVLAGQQMQWPITSLSPQALQGLSAGGVLKAKFNADLDEQTLPLVSALP